MYPCRQNFLVLGLSKSGKAAAEFLLKKNANVYIYDDLENERIAQTSQLLEEKGAKKLSNDRVSSACDFCDVLVLSPGVPIDHPISVAFKRKRKAVVGEAEIAARYLNTPIVAVTGTNGKTTTVSMLTEVFTKSGMQAVSSGNIGTPMLEICEDKNDVVVAEISSFQLETLNSLRPHIAIILNITEDHLNRHYNMENYIFLKSKILKNMTESEFVILNYDDDRVRKFAEQTKANVLFFSVRDRVRGAYYEDGDLYFGKEKIMSADDLPIGGLHNIQNALAVIIAARIMGVTPLNITKALSDFKGVKHRIEKIACFNGVTYIDDSKGTNVDATLTAIHAMKAETVLLLGGKDKGYNYTKLFANMQNSKIVHAVLYGANRYSLLKSAMECHYDKITVCDSFEFAVRVAALLAKEGQNVLLSPASASFDEFTSYEERGDKFVEIVQSFESTYTAESTDTEIAEKETCEPFDEEDNAQCNKCEHEECDGENAVELADGNEEKETR